ncbi:MAG TPA: cysteine synthase A [Candidatus Borkfalkia excrementigallinarum]|uniref:Cysteine synthase n=1 Tax=Candidatus Borkfalkia excrementigallinarum TaxID=2838506 RepID=A0A9D1ZU59_9FIRM|nr:cysteine synthase A [Candidatus Borkfalkia excrementigallinarum]
MLYENIAELVGKTPLMRLNGLQKKRGLRAEILAKLEYFNPTGSVKDRPALAMIEAMEREGKIGADTLLIEPTSGNTGIGLAAVCAIKGYTLVLTMPETMSVERRKLLAAFGAKIVLTDGKAGMRGAIAKAEELHAQNKNSIICGQFVNPANPAAHYRTTGPEIWADCEGKLDFFVAGVGTGGTLGGTAKFLKEKDPSVKAVAVEPMQSAVLSGKPAGPHKLQGIGAGFVPEILDTSLIDEIIPVSDEDAFETGREIARTDGVFAGISAGAAVFAAVQLASRPENAGKRIAVVIPDTGARYLSTALFPES